MDLWFIDESSIIFWAIVFLLLVGFAYFLKLWKNISMLKIIYIVLATFIGSVIFYLFVILCLEIYWIGWETIATDDSKTRNYAIAFIGTVSGFGALFGVYLAIRRTEESKRQSEAAEREATTAEQGLITDRLNKAVEGLGKTNQKDEPVIEVRLGALYALERIAQDSLRDHVPVMEILCAYVRQNSPKKTYENSPAEIDPLREDILAALTIIGRRDKWRNGKKHLKHEQQQNYSINLQNCDLHGAPLNGANISKARLYNSNLTEALLNHANLTDATLNHTILIGAQLNNANLTGAGLSSIIWSVTSRSSHNKDYKNINNKIPKRTKGFLTKINNANTQWAYMEDGNFSSFMHPTQKQLDVMFCGMGVIISNKLNRPKHWPTKYLEPSEFDEAYKEWLEKIYPDNDFDAFIKSYKEWQKQQIIDESNAIFESFQKRESYKSKHLPPSP